MSNPDLAKGLAPPKAVDSRDAAIQSLKRFLTSSCSEEKDMAVVGDMITSNMVLVSVDSLISEARSLAVAASMSRCDLERVERELIEMLFKLFVLQFFFIFRGVF